MDTGTAIQTVALAILVWHLPSAVTTARWISNQTLHTFFRIYTYIGAISAETDHTNDWEVNSVPEPQPEPHTGAIHYLTAAQGLTNHLTSAARVALWRRARKYITRAIKLRRRFWLAGDRLKSQRLQDLYKGIERVRGVVSRVRDANTGVRITRNL
jgi:hypothetical protein